MEPRHQRHPGCLGLRRFNNQPPALLYNDYDGSGGIDYCTLFAAANTPCGTLIPGQRATTTPGFGIDTDTIQLARGDTTYGITASILLPSRFTVDINTLDLVWSVHHDPDTTHPVTLGSGTLLVDAERRATTRWIVLRATTGMGDDETIVNDYRLRILAGSGGLQNPGLRFTSPVDALLVGNPPRLRCYPRLQWGAHLRRHRYGWQCHGSGHH